MVRLRSPHSTAVADVREESVSRYLAQGWQEADPPDDGHVCEACGFTAKSAAGLGAHRRSHDT